MSEREEFEKWSRLYIPDLKMPIDEGEYIDDEQQNNFEVWQAATKQSEARIKALESALELYVKSGFGNSTDFYKQAEAHGSATLLLSMSKRQPLPEPPKD